MKTNLKLFFLALPIFLILDAVWLGWVAKDFYHSRLGPLIPLGVSWAPAILFYALFVTGVVFFAVKPALREASFRSSLLRGAFFGLVTYGTYDLTNQATIKGWPVIVTVVDLLWGSSLSAVVSSLTFLMSSGLKKKRGPTQ